MLLLQGQLKGSRNILNVRFRGVVMTRKGYFLLVACVRLTAVQFDNATSLLSLPHVSQSPYQ